MKRLAVLFTLLVLLASACGPRLQPSPTQPVRSVKPCGDGVCKGPENPENCPQDCTIDEGSPTEVSSESPSKDTQEPDSPVETGPQANTYWVTNPTSNAKQYVEVIHPETWGGQALPTLILIPGGLGSSQDFRGQPRKSANTLADAGYTVIIFDPDGRGRSEGSEDNNGFVHQDGLAAIVRFAATLSEVDADKVGLVSFSYGVTMASGVLARYPSLNMQFLIDWEGPADRNDTGGCDEDRTGHLKDVVGCDDEMFWAEREALTFISQIGVPYQRLQTNRDHAQPDVLSAFQMVNAAVQGQSPWVRLNDLPPNQTYDLSTSPPMLTDSVDGKLMDLIMEYAPQLFEMS